MAVAERALFFGVPIDLLTMDQTVARVRDAMRKHERLHHVALNVAKLVLMRNNEDLMRDVTQSDMVGVDGMGIVWSARMMGIPVPERVTGTDLMYQILGLCEREGFRPYFLGATPEVLENTLLAAKRLWPKLDIAGSHHGYFNADNEKQVIDDIRNAKADCLFVAISTPVKERLCYTYRDTFGVPFVMGVGGSFDVLAGKTPRAPIFLQKVGLEWLFRLLCEPRRMWRRYLGTNAAFAWMMIKALFVKREEPSSTRKT